MSSTSNSNLIYNTSNYFISSASNPTIYPQIGSQNTFTSPHLAYAQQRRPLTSRAKLTTTLWEDEGTICYQVDANGYCVARRQDNDMINGTKLLNVAGMSRGKRDGILKNEKGRVVIKVGAMHLKGVWITFDRAKLLAAQYRIQDLLYPLFVDDPTMFLYSSLHNPINRFDNYRQHYLPPSNWDRLQPPSTETVYNRNTEFNTSSMVSTSSDNNNNNNNLFLTQLDYNNKTGASKLPLVSGDFTSYTNPAYYSKQPKQGQPQQSENNKLYEELMASTIKQDFNALSPNYSKTSTETGKPLTYLSAFHSPYSRPNAEYDSSSSTALITPSFGSSRRQSIAKSNQKPMVVRHHPYMTVNKNMQHFQQLNYKEEEYEKKGEAIPTEFNNKHPW
ncbi:hypothetical protein G6F70_004445 [Rhizopus microsporus]|nr:hypothetical protein G6F71_008392 [Rhizopus microsporus]RCH93162.1 hypothetical protein CU097_011121 [Rhizopus azygosporus]KAG1199988.1 hypothetical protein G6F70_004445 [Rhizopus microsporus]KAG1207037.1 hypothetical protein G6F69_008364 [Rhizopus microsporus]KAG1227645.1 hypothetical protein G6F67_008320 [Rhizopus microsporus]